MSASSAAVAGIVVRVAEVGIATGRAVAAAVAAIARPRAEARAAVARIVGSGKSVAIVTNAEIAVAAIVGATAVTAEVGIGIAMADVSSRPREAHL